jgi:hypothetical protein
MVRVLDKSKAFQGMVAGMSRKNRDLCEEPYCRERWAYRVSAWDPYFGGRLGEERLRGPRQAISIGP